MLDKPLVFSKEWFDRHQHKILRFANSRIGRRLLRIHGNQSNVGKARITKISPNSISWDNKTEYRTHDKFAKRLYYGLKPLWLVLHGWDFVFGKVAKELDFGFSTLTAYPDAHPESATVDGYVERSGVDETLTTIRAAAGNTFDDSIAANYFARLTASTTTDQYAASTLSIYTFDTSSIPDTDVVSAVVFSLFGASKQNTLGSPDLNITSPGTAPGTATALANLDYDRAASQTPIYGTVTYAGFDATDTVYTDITLDANGIAHINKTGVTGFAAQLSWMYNSTGLTWSSGANSRLYAYYADETGTSKDPKLVVTHAAPGSPSASASPSASVSPSASASASRSPSSSVSPSSSASASRSPSSSASASRSPSASVSPSSSASSSSSASRSPSASVSPSASASASRSPSASASASRSPSASLSPSASASSSFSASPSPAPDPIASAHSQFIPKTYRYEVYRNGAKLGDIKDVISEFEYTQTINSAGAELNITVGQNVDTPGLDTVGSANDNIMIRNGNDVRVFEYSKYYPNGKQVFTGQINRWSADYFKDTVEITVLSNGFDLDNYVVQGSDLLVDVTQVSQNSSYLVQYLFDGTYKAVGQSWQTGGSVTVLEGITLKINTQGLTTTVVVSVYASSVGVLMGTTSREINSTSAEDFKFTFSPTVTVASSTNYFFTVSVIQDGNTCLVHYADSNVYANGIMYIKTSVSGGWNQTPTDTVLAASDLYFKTHYSGNSTEFTYTSTDPSTMLLGIMSYYASAGGSITASSSSVSMTGVSATYRFKVNTALEAIKKILDLSPAGWYFYVDVATDILYFRDTSDTATHRLTKGKDIQMLEMTASIENVVNALYFSGGPTGGVNLFKFYSNAASIANYGPRLDRQSDNRVTQSASADLIGNSAVDTNKDEQYQTRVVVLHEVRDITLFKPGDTTGYQGFQTLVDNLILQIAGIHYTPDLVEMTVGVLPPRVNSTVEQLKRDMEAEQTLDNPASPT